MLKPTPTKSRKAVEHVHLDEMTEDYDVAKLFTGETYPSVNSYSEEMKNLVSKCHRLPAIVDLCG
jgi:hypothetical protein